MSRVSKAAAQRLAADIRNCMLGGHAIAVRFGGKHGCTDPLPGFVGGLSVVLQDFIRAHAGSDVAAEVYAAFEYAPSADEIDAHNAKMVEMLKPREQRSGVL